MHIVGTCPHTHPQKCMCLCSVGMQSTMHEENSAVKHILQPTYSISFTIVHQHSAHMGDVCAVGRAVSSSLQMPGLVVHFPILSDSWPHVEVSLYKTLGGRLSTISQED